MLKARELLEPQGGGPTLHDELDAYFERATVPAGGGVVWPGEYLVVLGRKRE